MECKLCGGSKVQIIYHGRLKTDLLSGHTKKDYDVWQCGECGTIWNEAYKEEQSDFYESDEYRNRIDGEANPELFYSKYDVLTLEKLSITGTGIFRNKIVADVGCGAGSFLDFVSGVAKEIVAIEPSETFRNALAGKGYHAFRYANEAYDYFGKCDVVTSFDVIEHVENPRIFVKDMYSLCACGGVS